LREYDEVASRAFVGAILEVIALYRWSVIVQDVLEDEPSVEEAA